MANRRTAELSRTQAGASRSTSPAPDRSETSSGSKAPSPTEKTQIDFQFLNFSHPQDAKASNARKAVRSHVTKQQHQKEQKLQQERRAKSFQGSSSSSSSAAAADLEPTPLSRRPHAETFPTERPTTLELPTGTSAGPSSPEMSSAASSPTHLSDRQIDPYALYPELWHPYIAQIMDDYLSNMAVDIPGIAETEIQSRLQTRFGPFVMTDPASLHAVMLVAATRFGRIRGPRSHAIDLLQLRGMAIREINRALEDETRATQDQVIIAVAMMACYEVLYGDQAVFNTHMTGLLRIVSLRRGLPQLGLEGLLEAILLWIDANGSSLLGSRIYFDRAAFPTGAAHPRPAPMRFTGGLRRPSQ
ncbi:hypothetical protein LTR78_002490 [Recurvomyces mirabilis]|uniref:Uncharacterized protein n=1 Tax=Recurvomyces mirabilis TaxID=574656 RepID=A0AAE1C497_9PEZI|nr:hypothetical protein LTR78_002490 [Recurvomyces mirabilis]KAK5157419.1 hypothetical protein LTS14_004184 [Recurvomyces mirabilis]